MKKIQDFLGKHVLVLGLGKSGTAAAKVLHELGAEVIVNDSNAKAEIPIMLTELGIKVVLGSHPLELLTNVQLMIKNPGIPYNNVLVMAAMNANIPIWTDVELAYRISEASIIGVTGTNGKTTTTTLIAEILNADGQTAKLAGNIGFPASEVAMEVTVNDIMVMELSSFQLMGVDRFCPKIAVLTNLFSAHLDYHGSQEEYEAAKWRIQKNMTSDDFLVLNFNQEKSQIWTKGTSATVVSFATDKVVDGAYSINGKIFFRGEEILAISDLLLPGEHNLENALAAIAVAKLCGASNRAICKVLTTFVGVKHRLQYLGKLEGRKIYNDSKATNILATQKALSGFENTNLWLLAGGLDRGNGFEELSDMVTGLKGMVVFGETAPKLRQLADRLHIPVFESENVATALHEVFPKTTIGDTILLSPACASWDQYKTFEERGDLFIKAFNELKLEQNL